MKMEKFLIKRKNFFYRKGQSLIEILIALGIGAIIVLGASSLIASSLRGSSTTKLIQESSFLGEELFSAVKSMADSEWHKIYCPVNGVAPCLAKGTGNPYYINYSGVPAVVSGVETATVDGREFSRFFYLNNINRGQCGAGDVTQEATTACVGGPGTAGVSEDPSTQQVTIIVTQGANQLFRQDYYLTRSRNFSIKQNDWVGGAGQTGPIINPNDKYEISDGITTSTPGQIRIQGL